MSLPKLVYLLDGLWCIITTPDHFPVFRNEKDSEAKIVAFVVMLYICLEFAISGACILCFCCIFLFLLAFIINLTDVISFHQLEDWKSYLIVTKMTFSCLQKLLKKFVLLFYQKKVQILVFWEAYIDTWYEPPP